MKKIALLMLFFSTMLGYSQVKNYTFSQTAGTFTEVTGGTLLGTSSTNDMFFVDPTKLAGGYGATGVGLPIGFNFVFNGFTYDRFAVATEGWISLGTSTLNPAVNAYVTDIRSPMDSKAPVTPEVLAARISALGIDLAPQTGSTLLFKTTGTAPDQVLTVQWKNYRKNLSGGSFDFQIKLYETSNKVEFVYGKVTSISTSGSYQVGLRAEPSTTASNFINRTSQLGWDVTAAGTSATDAVLMNSSLTPASGTTFTWTPPTCGTAKNLVASAITANSATLNWDYYTPKPLGCQYVVSTSTDLPTGSGTVATTGTVSLTDLSPDTGYNVFMRSACGSEFSNWELKGAFRTQCIATANFKDNFDSYPTGVGVRAMPYCWAKGGNGEVYVATGGTDAVAAVTGLFISAKGIGVTTVAYAIMPKVNTLQLNTYRLKFNVFPLSTGGTLDLGYFTDSNDVSTFVSLQTINLPLETATSAMEFEVFPKGIPAGVSCLGFKNSGQPTWDNSGYTQVYIDDVIWEPIPPCNDVKAIAANVLSTSAKIKWTPKGSETAWQYVYAPSAVKDPSGLTPVDVASTAQATINGLETTTSYNVWVRSNCGNGAHGYWIGPANFTTTCAPVTEFVRSFEGTSSFPPCWRKVGAEGLAKVENYQNSPNYPVALHMVSLTPESKAVVTMEPVSNAGAGTHRLKFKFLGEEIGSILEVGYLTDVNDHKSFVMVQSCVTKSTTEYESVTTLLGTAPTTPYLAFRVPGVLPSHLFIIDVVWEPIPKCTEVSAIASSAITFDSAKLSWTTGGTENQWQYVTGSASTTNPYALVAKDLVPFVYEKDASATITGLIPSTFYKVWLRSKCSSSAFGAWIGPVTFTTTCAPVTEFIQNFDAGTAFPTCWAWPKVGTGGGVSITAITEGEPSAPNVLSILSNSESKGIVAMVPVSNADAGTHRLRFKFRGSVVNSVLEVGYIMNVADPSTFSPLRTFTSSSTGEYIEAVADLGIEPGSQFLAFRNSGTPAGNIYIDDVNWEPIPVCKEVVSLNANSYTSTSVDLAWIAGGSEKAWQYVVGGPAVTDPSKLVPVDVTASEITVNGLTPSTSYKIWVRSKCGTAKFGAWVGAVAFTTTCAPVTEFTQNFDTTTSMPTCWAKVGTGGTVLVEAATDSPSSPDVMTIESISESSPGILAIQPVSNAGVGTHRLKFKFRGSVVGSSLEVGYLNNPLDPNSFISLQSFNASSATVYDLISIIPIVPAKIQVLAFRKSAHPASKVFIDDVVWEAIPTCPDITSVATNGIMGNSVGLKWTTDGTANAWQYVIGTSSATDPSMLTPVTVAAASATISNLTPLVSLTPSTTYKVWVRTKCDAAFGAWSNALSFTTLCPGVSSFTQKFDASTAVPECWKQVGTAGVVTVNAISGASTPNVLALSSNATAKATVAMPNVINASAGTHRLKFKFSSNVAGGVLEVGYVTDVNDQFTFVSLESYVSSVSAFDAKTVILGIKPVAGSTLAFRNPGTPESIVYVDDIGWEAIPSCADVTNIVVKLPTSNSVQLSWDAVGTTWQYAYAPSTVTDPGTLPSTSIFDTNSKALTVNGLSSNTSYKIWVRSNCGNGVFGYWQESAVFMTPCPSVQVITENFEAGLVLPNCWRFMDSSGSVAVVASKGTGATNALELKSPAVNTSVFVAIPSLSTAVTGGYRMRFKCKAFGSGSKIDVICYKDPINFSGTGSFTTLKTIAVSNVEIAFDDVLPATETPHLGLRIYNDINAATVYVDDFVWELSLPTTCATGIATTPDVNCGNYATAISWNAAPHAAGYRLTIGTTSGGSDVMNNKEIGNVLAYSFKGKSSTKYYFKLVPYNTLGSAAGCVEQIFTTAANNCYCVSVPSANDGTGITNVQIGDSNFANTDITYKDFTTNQVNVVKGGNADLKISFNTNDFGYYTNIWIDSNSNFEFEPSEIVFSGKGASHTPNVFDVSFFMPSVDHLGPHTMRIGSTRFEQTPADPCYNGIGAVTLDFKINVVESLGTDTFDEIDFAHYPNPVRDILNLSLNQEIANVEVYNLLGQKMINQSGNSNQIKIDMSGLASGAYLVKVSEGNQSKTIKVIKE